MSITLTVEVFRLHVKVNLLLKKHVPYIVCLVVGLITGILISAVISRTTGFTLFGDKEDYPLVPASAGGAELTELSYRVVGYIKSKDYRALSEISHPEYGIVFSPYATITLTTNKRFSTGQVAMFGNDTKLYVWGVYASTGEPIELTISDYFNEFVFDKDYSAAPVIGVNNIVRSGDALENITDLFTNVQFVDFHMPGTENEGNGDVYWSTLRLGFEEYDGMLRLTVILHSARTV